MRRGYSIHVELNYTRNPQTPDVLTPRFRSELWWQPFSGWMVACTRWTSTRAWAVRDGKKYLQWPAGEKASQ